MTNTYKTTISALAFALIAVTTPVLASSTPTADAEDTVAKYMDCVWNINDKASFEEIEAQFAQMAKPVVVAQLILADDAEDDDDDGC